MQVDVQTTLGIGEAHLQESGDETTSRDIMTGHDPSLLDELLNGHEGISEIFRILYGRHVVAHLTKTLCEGRTAKALLVETEVYMIERSILVIDQYRRYHLLDV